ncbi:hypothetical protein BDZ94DRAFT_355653 [Collybia nuda]|uniref:Uncharacterized protein n=1 Tax=Collybia nuda TaxID=64659 RepID=A0A9P6CBV7_9AGAR|nr:hypothetical protein BDZ94DRAFT_355653 [Collybia nuda]
MIIRITRCGSSERSPYSIKKGMSHSTQISVLRSHPAFRKFLPEKIQRWLSEGHKYASLARGGSLYILYLTWVEWANTMCGRYLFFSSATLHLPPNLNMNHLVEIYCH